MEMADPLPMEMRTNDNGIKQGGFKTRTRTDGNQSPKRHGLSEIVRAFKNIFITAE
jgi:hypothetical protein